MIHFINWVIDWFNWLTSLLIDWLIDIQTDRLIRCLYWLAISELLPGQYCSMSIMVAPLHHMQYLSSKRTSWVKSQHVCMPLFLYLKHKNYYSTVFNNLTLWCSFHFHYFIFCKLRHIFITSLPLFGVFVHINQNCEPSYQHLFKLHMIGYDWLYFFGWISEFWCDQRHQMEISSLRFQKTEKITVICDQVAIIPIADWKINIVQIA